MFRIKRLLRRSSKCPSQLAQDLPPRILKRIAFYTSNFDPSTRCLGEGEEASHAVTKDFLPLLSVCQGWRSVAKPIFYHSFSLTISADSTEIEATEDLTHSINDVIQSGAESLARCVTITIPYTGVLNGKIPALLSSDYYQNAVFPEVAQLRFNLYSGYNITDDETADYSFYTECFCTHIHGLFPNARDYQFKVYPFASAYDSEMIGGILMGLTQGTRTFEYIHSSSLVDICGLTQLTNLTHICFQTDVSSEDCIEMVRMSAGTLESAELQHVNIAGSWVDLVQDQQGNPIVYRCLRALSIHVDEHSLCGELAAPEGTPFPSLTHLSCTGGYPFANDVLFRGNHATLQSLSVHIDVPKLLLFEEHGVFARERYPNLQRMEIAGPNEDFSIEPALALKVARIPFEIGARVQSIWIQLDGWLQGCTILHALRLSPHVRAQLRVFDACHIQFTLAETVELVRLLPNLDSLTCGLMDEAQWTSQQGGMLSAKNLKDICSLKCTVGSRLLSFRLGSCEGVTGRKALEYVLTLAILFPSLKRVNGTSQIGDRFDGYFNEVLAKPDYWPYSRHLRTLEIA
ncbi:hypothetical protein GQ54DRAFT_10561 [Martensiomyces pterosporus]|nr:hypothetical protein GQ54DRAFT_10561 [Martensiomyces pterosporus]